MKIQTRGFGLLPGRNENSNQPRIEEAQGQNPGVTGAGLRLCMPCAALMPILPGADM